MSNFTLHGCTKFFYMVNFDVTADVGHPPFDTQLLLAIQDIDKVLPLVCALDHSSLQPWLMQQNELFVKKE